MRLSECQRLIREVRESALNVHRILATWKTQGNRGWAGGVLYQRKDTVYVYVETGYYIGFEGPTRNVINERFPYMPVLDQLGVARPWQLFTGRFDDGDQWVLEKDHLPARAQGDRESGDQGMARS